MYDSERQAIHAFKRLAKSMKNIRKTIGDSLASGQLEPEHGLSTDSNNSGHFDLHPYANIDWLKTFEPKGLIP